MNTLSTSTAPEGSERRYIPCLATLRSMYAGLTDSERRVADFLLANGGWVLQLPIADVARQSSVGMSTIMRLCSKMGYSGFSDLKLALAVELLSPDSQALEPIHTGDAPAQVVEKTLRFGLQSLQDTLHLLDHNQVVQAAELLAQARHVHLYATNGLSRPVAEIAQHRLLLLGIHANVFFDPAQQAMTAGLLSTGDVALGLSNSGDSAPVMQALAAAREAGAKTVCITSAPQSPVAQIADVALCTGNYLNTAGYSVVDRDSQRSWWGDAVTSRIPMLAVIEALYATTALGKYRQPDVNGDNGQ